MNSWQLLDLVSTITDKDERGILFGVELFQKKCKKQVRLGTGQKIRFRSGSKMICLKSEQNKREG